MRRSLPKLVGGRSFYASVDGGLKFLRPQMSHVDPELQFMARALVKPGDCIWDIGANVGLFAFAASGLAGSNGLIYALEPDTNLACLLERSSLLQSDGCAPVHVLPIAISDANALAKFIIAKRSRAANHLDGFGSKQAGGVRQEQFVLTVTLDWLLTILSPPDLLKIDIEGAEILALKGATSLLSKHRPRIICEILPHNREAASTILKSYGYEFFSPSGEPIQNPARNTVAIFAG